MDLLWRSSRDMRWIAICESRAGCGYYPHSSSEHGEMCLEATYDPLIVLSGLVDEPLVLNAKENANT
jgi:hypothetical protein